MTRDATLCPHPGRLLAASAGVCVATLLLYRATLLPGVDFGDTASLQIAGGSIEATPRQSYPLYFAFGNLVVWTAGGEPAFGMNLASAVAGALACGAIAALTGMITGSALAGLFSGLLLAGSYTFWSQSIIAEVYALHMLMVCATLVALVWWGSRPESLNRLAFFFGVYALGFGNHLMMVLLAPAAVLYIALTGGARTLVSPRVVAMAVLFAVLGALQYAWNFLYLWSLSPPPGSILEGLRIFWFDVTKSDWRETLVLGVDEYGMSQRWPMYVFDLRQQMGFTGVALAGAGVAALARQRLGLAALVVVGYATALAFAITYNVGDVHVFLLPSHLFVIVAAGCGAAALCRAVGRVTNARSVALAAALVLLTLPVWRMADTYPAVDRSSDRRPMEHLQHLTAGLSPEDTLFIADLNWQVQNGLDYYGRHVRPELNYLRAGNRLLSLPMLIEENRTHGREVILTSSSARALKAAYGDLFRVELDVRASSAPLHERVDGLERGTPYVLAVLQSYAWVPVDADELDLAVAKLSGGRADPPPNNVYMVIAGETGESPRLVRSSPRPFRTTVELAHLDVDIRMESWLPTDTMRRAGFGHVIVEGRHRLTLERGVSFVALTPEGQPRFTTYAWGPYEPEPRYRIAPVRMK